MTVPDRPKPRKAARDVRRRQLMEATLDVLATRGYASLTISDVSRAAGLSLGIVNFHFDSKAVLLADTLKYLAVQYRDNWTAAVNAAGDDQRPDRWPVGCTRPHPAGHQSSGSAECAAQLPGGVLPCAF